jgi:hypothetical protein
MPGRFRIYRCRLLPRFNYRNPESPEAGRPLAEIAGSEN